MTAHPSDQVYKRAEQLGISHILLKPFPLAELARVVCDLMGKESGARPGTQGEGFVERRQCRKESFPLQLYDGSWVLADRRRTVPTPPVPDDTQQLTGE